MKSENDSSYSSHHTQHECAADRPAPQSRENIHENKEWVSNSASRVLRVDVKSPRATHTIISPSSRAGEMGRRLAQEREKNKMLMQQMNTMQDRITFLENNPSLAALSFTSPRAPQKNLYIDHIQELQRELKLETVRREEAERKVANCFVQTIAESSHDSVNSLGCAKMSLLENKGRDTLHHTQIDQSLVSDIKHNPLITNLLERANNLLSDTHSTSSNPCHDSSAVSQQNLLTYDTSYKDKDNQTVTQELMKDFRGLLEGFFTEQRSKNETMTPSSDIIWLFEELEWRFEEIRRGYEDERLQWIESSEQNTSAPNTSTHDVDMDEWKECLQRLIELVGTQDTRVDHANDLCLNYTTQTLRNEVKSLRQQLSTLAQEHNKRCLELKQDMNRMQHNHKEESDKQSKTIVSLESKIKEQNNIIHQLEQSIDDERRKFNSSKESTAARMNYLEEVVRSLKTVKSPISRDSSSREDMQYNSGMKADRELSDDSSLILSMSQEIEKLSNALQESEEQRAQAIEEFQLEREGHIRQYQQLSLLLTQFLGSDDVDCNGSKA